MAETVVLIAPGEEHIIRVRCAAPEVPAPAEAPAAVVAPVIEEEEAEGEIGIANVPPGSRPNVAPPEAPGSMSLSQPFAQNSQSTGRMPNARKSRKNRKNNGATRKNRKQSGGNSYMKFATEERKRVLKDHPEMKSRVVDVAKEIGKRWRALSESERKKY